MSSPIFLNSAMPKPREVAAGLPKLMPALAIRLVASKVTRICLVGGHGAARRARRAGSGGLWRSPHGHAETAKDAGGPRRDQRNAPYPRRNKRQPYPQLRGIPQSPNSADSPSRGR